MPTIGSLPPTLVAFVATVLLGFLIGLELHSYRREAGPDLGFGTTRTLNEVRLYFKDSRPASTTYRAPSAYTVQYHNGSSWVNMPDQTKSPAVPRANYNLVRFPDISAQRIRVLATNAAGAKTGLTEVKVFNRGGVQPPANQAVSATASASYTSAWESVTAVNDGIDRPRPTTP